MKISSPAVAAAMSGTRMSRRRMLALAGASSVAALAAVARSQTPAPLSCVARPRQTEGPFFVEEPLDRSDLRSDPRSGQTSAGVPLRLAFRVSRLAQGDCAALAGARVDVWHCDAAGRYSDVRGFGASTAGTQFLRGYQLTDAHGVAQFLTIYPGWYFGRAVHVHFKIRSSDARDEVRDFTSQLYFDERLTERVYAGEPYAQRPPRWLRNEDDALYREGGRELTLAPEPEGEGYAARFDVALPV